MLGPNLSNLVQEVGEKDSACVEFFDEVDVKMRMKKLEAMLLNNSRYRVEEWKTHRTGGHSGCPADDCVTCIQS